MGHFSQATTAKAKVAIIASRPAANAAAVVQANDRVFAFGGLNPALVFFVDHGCFGHDENLSLFCFSVYWDYAIPF